MPNVLIISPAPMMRAGLRAMLATEDIQVVGEAAALDEVTARAERAQVLVLADPELLEGRAREYLGDAAPALVVLSDEVWPVNTLGDMPLSGWAVVPVEVTAAELQAAVNAAAQGMVVLPLALAKQALAPRNPAQLTEVTNAVEQLTPRELEVLQLLSEGLCNKLIALRLHISEHTVKFHVSSIYAKLSAVSRADAVSRGSRLGLITL